MMRKTELLQFIRPRAAAILMAVAWCAPMGVTVAEHHDGHGQAHEAVLPQVTDRVETDLAQAAVSISNARIRLPLPGQTTGVVYLTLHNRTGHELVLNAVDVQGSARAELHQHVHEDGMMRMRKVNRIVVAAGKALELSPGGYHIMALEMAPSPGDATLQRAYPTTLSFESGERITVNAWPVH